MTRKGIKRIYRTIYRTYHSKKGRSMKNIIEKFLVGVGVRNFLGGNIIGIGAGYLLGGWVGAAGAFFGDQKLLKDFTQNIQNMFNLGMGKTEKHTKSKKEGQKVYGR